MTSDASPHIFIAGLDPGIHRNKPAGESPPFSFRLFDETNRLPKRQLLSQDGLAVRKANG
jgi:hypothetical protein